MRDLETIHAAIEAAETGHVVFGTLHTNSASATVNRIIDVFPKDQQDQIRTQLSVALIGVLSQTLLPKKPDGVIAAYEMMVVTPAISNLIRENKIHQVPSIIQTGKKDGMQLLDQHIMEYLMSNQIDPTEAYMKANNKSAFRQYLKEKDRKSTRLNSSHIQKSRMPSSA